jgi:DNA polymerase-1
MGKVISVDTEASGLNPSDVPFALGFCDNKLKKSYYRWKPFDIRTPMCFEKIKKKLENPNTTKVFFNAIFDLVKISKMSIAGVPIKVKGIIHDVYIMARLLLRNEPKHNLRDLIKSQLREDDDISELEISHLTKGRKAIKYYELPKQLLKDHCKKDVEYTMKLYYYLKASGILKDPIYKMESQLIPVIVSMESLGIKVDLKYCKQKEIEYKRKLSGIEGYFKREYGVENIASPKQLQDLFYHKWRLTPPKTTPKGDPSTDALALILLRDEHVDIQKIKRYRGLKHSLTNYFVPLQTKSVNGNVYPHFNPMGDVDRIGIPTGRFSSNNPNLQSIKRGPEIRSCFIPRPGYFFCAHDYSQIEMRLYAYLSNDQMMVQAYKNGESIHKLHQQKFVDPYIANTGDLKDGKGVNYAIAKNIGFGILYGIGPTGMKQYLDKHEIHISVPTVSKMLRGWHREHPSLLDMRKVLDKELRKHGYITDLFGRKYYLPQWRS